MKKLDEILTEHSFFHGLEPADVSFIAGCAKNVVFKPKQTVVTQGENADEFYLIRTGQVAVTMDIPGRRPIIIQTAGAHELLGLSWFIPPYRWTFSAYSVQLTRAIAINGACLRDKCEKDTRLGYELMKRLVQILVMREEALRVHVLDVYGKD